MVVSRRFEPPDLVAATLRGVVTVRDQTDLLAWVRAAIRRAGDVRVLIRLEAFAGWKFDELTVRETMWLDEDDGVSRMAIVGRPEWKIGVLTFIAQPLRRLTIKYFDTEAAARLWLASDAQTSAGTTLH